MIQLRIISGKMAGTEVVTRRFPFRVGRASSNQLVLEDAGVWDLHFDLQTNASHEVVLTNAAQGFLTVDGQEVQQAPLRNGGIIEIGGVKMQFGFSPTRQKGLALREWLFWIALTTVFASQIILIYRLPG